MMSVTTAGPSSAHVVRQVKVLRDELAQARSIGRQIALVPTMGALHAGHLSLINAARESGAFLVVSIYVNPTQFGPGEDFEQYPRTQDADRAACEKAGVDLLFVPEHSEMYPPGDQTRVHPGTLAEKLCGPFRPGHFEGVCTVVAKLFNLVQPDVAYFGQKDAQQALILQRMIADLAFPIRIEVRPIVRDSDGLALSSRNARLKGAARAEALSLYRALCKGRELFEAGGLSNGRIIAAMRAMIGEFAEIRVDYLSMVHPDTLEDALSADETVMLAGAIRLGDVRLIDNIVVSRQKRPLR